MFTPRKVSDKVVRRRNNYVFPKKVIFVDEMINHYEQYTYTCPQTNNDPLFVKVKDTFLKDNQDPNGCCPPTSFPASKNGISPSVSSDIENIGELEDPNYLHDEVHHPSETINNRDSEADFPKEEYEEFLEFIKKFPEAGYGKTEGELGVRFVYNYSDNKLYTTGKSFHKAGDAGGVLIRNFPNAMRDAVTNILLHRGTNSITFYVTKTGVFYCGNCQELIGYINGKFITDKCKKRKTKNDWSRDLGSKKS